MPVGCQNTASEPNQKKYSIHRMESIQQIGSKTAHIREIENADIHSVADKIVSMDDPVVESLPEGGLWGWLAVAGCFAIQFVTSSLVGDKVPSLCCQVVWLAR